MPDHQAGLVSYFYFAVASVVVSVAVVILVFVIVAEAVIYLADFLTVLVGGQHRVWEMSVLYFATVGC